MALEALENMRYSYSTYQAWFAPDGQCTHGTPEPWWSKTLVSPREAEKASSARDGDGQKEVQPCKRRQVAFAIVSTGCLGALSSFVTILGTDA